MTIDITGRHVEVTPALRAFIEEKLQKLDRLVEGTIEAHVVLQIAKHVHTAEIQIKSRHVLLTGTEQTGDLYASIGEVVDKLERQLLKHKEKIHDHKHRRGPRDPEVAATIEANVAEAEGVSLDPAPDGESPRIMRSSRYRVKPMSPEDAVLELEATQQDLLVFRETRSYRINVVYREKDGNFGLVDPDF